MADPPAKVLFQTAIGELPLRDTLRLVGWSLCSFMRPDGTAWPAVGTIARRAGRGVSTTRAALRELEALGLLVVQQRPGRAALYLATPPGAAIATPPAWAGGVAASSSRPLRGSVGDQEGSRANGEAELVADLAAAARAARERLQGKVKPGGEEGLA